MSFLSFVLDPVQGTAKRYFADFFERGVSGQLQDKMLIRDKVALSEKSASAPDMEDESCEDITAQVEQAAAAAVSVPVD